MNHLPEVLISQINIFYSVCELWPNVLSRAGPIKHQSITAFHLSESSSSYHVIYHITPDLPKDSAASQPTCLWAALLTLQSMGNSLSCHDNRVFFRWGITDHHPPFLVKGIIAKIPWVYFQWEYPETHFFAALMNGSLTKQGDFFLLWVAVLHLTGCYFVTTAKCSRMGTCPVHLFGNIKN